MDIGINLDKIFFLTLDWSGLVMFIALFFWVFFRVLEKILDLFKKHKRTYPLSAQRKGFAQNIGTWSVIVSEIDYQKRKSEMGFLKKLAKIYWPLLTYIAFAQFLLLYGAKGIAEQMNISFGLSLLMMGGLLAGLGLFRRKMIFDHVRGSFIPEGKMLDWDQEGFLGGLRLKVRFENKPRKVLLSRDEDKVLSKDKTEPFYWHGIMVQPESVYWHGTGLIVSEFKMLDSATDKMTEENWLKKIKLKDALHAILNAYVVAGNEKTQAIALLEYPGAIIMITPLVEHLKFLEQVGNRLKTRRNIPAIPAREIALSASQEYYTHFNDKKVAELLAQDEWIKKENKAI